MKKLAISISLVTLLALAVTGIAMAQDPTPTTQYGGGRHGGGGSGLLHDYMVEFYADTFGVSADELDARLDSGERMIDIAASYGYTAEEFYGLMNEARLYALDQALADGTITQEQYDWMQNGGGYGAGGGNGAGGGMGRGGGGGRHGSHDGTSPNQDCPYYTPSN